MKRKRKKNIPGRGRSTYEGPEEVAFRVCQQVPAGQLWSGGGWKGKRQTFPHMIAPLPRKRR